MEEEFQLIKDYDGDHGFSLEKGDRVKIIEANDDDPTLLLVQSYDDPRKKGLVPMDFLRKVPPSRNQTPDSALNAKSKKQEAKFKREVCIAELIDTEEEFSKDIQRVVEQYLLPLEEEIRPAPRGVMDSKDAIFNNLRQIAAFHNGIMIGGVKYFLKEPRTIGRTLLRLERDFDEHADYIRNEPIAQEILMKNDEIRDYFEDLSQEIGDDKILADHLKLPLQRINDYTLLLEELIRYSKVLSEDTTDLERALELMLWIPTRSNDLKFITNIEGYHGNIHKLGRLIRHNWFLTKDKSGGKGSERYCFLFKSRILICKVRRISEDRVVFVLKDIVKLPEVDFKNRSDKRTFEVHSTERDAKNFPYTFVAHEDDVKADWLQEIQNHLSDHLTETEHTIDDLKVQLDTDYDPFEPLKGVVLDISPEIEDNLDPIEHPGHRPLKHVPEPKRPPLEAPRKRRPIFECVDPTPSPSPPPEPEPEPEPESDPDMLSSFEEVSHDELVVDDSALAEDTEGEEELVEMVSGKRKPKYIPGKSKPLFHSTIRGSSNEPGENAVFACECEGVDNLVWLKDNRPLSDKLADRILISKEENVFRLEIKNVSESDSGTYTARAENGCGVSMSTAHLIVEKLTDEEKKVRAKATSPVFSVTLKDTELLESTHARFVVKVNGNPMPEIQFYKGDRLITEDDEFIQIVKDEANPGFYELVLPEVRLEDAGEYKCVASNKYSDESCSCFVNVINEKDVFAGLDEEFTGGEPKFTWLKNGRPFMPEERFKVIYKDEEDSIALVFQNVKPEDAGLYTCVASTSHGRISCSAELTVQGTIKEIQKLPKKAKIEAINKDFDGNVGSTTVIEVKVVGDPLPTARWFRDGEEILASGRHKIIYDEETETASLVIKNLCLEDGGEYNVVARNEVGSDSQFINLHVKAAPKIIKGLQDFTGLTGREIRLEIQVEASPKPIVQWYKDGMVIKKSNRIKYVADEASDTYTLIMENGVMEDAGTYSVVASNEFCQISDVCRLSMESPPQFLGSLQKEVETIEGDYVSFSVMVDGDPLPSVRWKFNGEEIKADGKHFKMNNEGNVFTLLISEVRREDAGQYACEIYNQWGGNECDGHLCVKCPPRFEKDLEDKVVKESDMDVEYSVKMNAFPKATVTWYHNETEITSRKKEYTCIEDGETYKLIIKQATTQLSGVYKCKAANEVGTTETSAKLTVHVFPKFTKELSDMEITEGETLKMTVSCKGVPEPDVKWYHNGEEIYSDSRIKISRDAKRIENYNLTITLVQKEDGGEYEVRATNERGTAVTKSLVTVLASTDHKKCVQDEESKEVLVNGVGTDDESDKSKAKQVKDEIASKKKIIADERKKIETNKSRFAGERPTTQKQSSIESGDEKHCTIRELCTEELITSAGSRGLVEEPPENEHYIKIQISRGVSIVSVSESEDFDTDISQTFDDVSYRKCSRNIYELEEEDQLDLELDRMNLSPHDKGSPSPVVKKHTRKSESIMNEINTNISGMDGENDAKVISYSSSRKSSVMEETQQSRRQQDSSPSRKAVSFDKQPSRIYEADNSDAAVEELFKRIQQQRNILGEILEQQHEKGQAEEILKSALKSPRQDSSSETEVTEHADKGAKPKDETAKLNRRQDSWEHLDDTDNGKPERIIRVDKIDTSKQRRDSWEKIDATEAQDIHVPIQVEAEKPKQAATPGKQKQARQDSWELVDLADNISGANERIITIEVEKSTGDDKDTDDETSLSKIRRRRSKQDSLEDVKVTEKLDKANIEEANADKTKDKVTKNLESKNTSRLSSIDHAPEKSTNGDRNNGERIIEVELEKPRNADGSDDDSLVQKCRRRRSRQDARQEVQVSEEYDNKDADQVQTDKPKKTSVDYSSSRRTSRLNSTASEKVETIAQDGIKGERIIEIEVEKPKKVDSEESLLQKSRRRRSTQGAEEEVQVSEECDADRVQTDKPKRTSVDHSSSKRTSRLNSTASEKKETIQQDGIKGERIIEIEVEKPKKVDSDSEESLLQKSRRRRSTQGAEEEVQVSEECDADRVQTDKPKRTSVDHSSSKRTSRLNSTTSEKVETIQQDVIKGERIIEIEVEKPKKVDSDSEESLLQKSRRRRSTQGAEEEVQVSEECDADQVQTDKPKRTSVDHSSSKRTSRLNSTASEKVETIQQDGIKGDRIIEIEVEKPRKVDGSDDESLLQKSRRRRSRQDADEEVQVSEEYDNKDADQVPADKPKGTKVKDVDSTRTSRLNSTIDKNEEITAPDELKKGERIIEIDVEKPKYTPDDNEDSSLQKLKPYLKPGADEKQADTPALNQVTEIRSVRTSRSTCVQAETDIDGQVSRTMSRKLSEHALLSEVYNDDESTHQTTRFDSVIAEKLGDNDSNAVPMLRGMSKTDSVWSEDSESLGRPDTWSADVSDIDSRGVSRLSSQVSRKSEGHLTEGEDESPVSRAHRLSSIDESKKSINETDDKSAPSSGVTSRRASRLNSTDIQGKTSAAEIIDQSTQGLKLTSRTTSRMASIDDSKKAVVEDANKNGSTPTSRLASKGVSRLQSTDDSTKPSDVETAPGSKVGSRRTSRQPSTVDSTAPTDENEDKSTPTSRVTSRRPSRLLSSDTQEKPPVEGVADESAPGSKLTSRRTSRVTSIDDSKKDASVSESVLTSKSASRGPSRLQSVDDSTKSSDVETTPGSRLGSRRTSRQPSTDNSKAPTGENEDKSTPTSRVTSRRGSRLQSTEIPEQPSAEDATDESTPGSKLISRRTSRVKSIDDSNKVVVGDTDKDESRPTSKLASKEASRLQSIDDSTKPSDIETAPGSKVGSRRTSRQPSTDDSRAPAGEDAAKSTPTSRVTSRRPSRLQSTEIPEQPSAEDATSESTSGSKLISRRTSRITSVDDSKEKALNDRDNDKSTPTSKLTSRTASRQQSDDDSKKPQDTDTAPGTGVSSRRTSGQLLADDSRELTDNKSAPTSQVASQRASRLQSTEISEGPLIEEVTDDSAPGSRLTSRRTSRITSINDSGKPANKENSTPASGVHSRRDSQLPSIDTPEKTPLEVSNEGEAESQPMPTRTSRLASIDASKSSTVASRRESRLQSTEDTEKPSSDKTAPGSEVGSRRTSRISSIDDTKKPTDEKNDENKPAERAASSRPSRSQSTEIPEQASVVQATDKSTPGSKLTSRRTSRVTSVDDSKQGVVGDVDKDESTPTSKLALKEASRLQSIDDSTKPSDVETVPGSKVGSRRTSRQPSTEDSRAPAGEDADRSTPTSRVTSRRPSRLQSTEIPEQPSADDATDKSTPGSKLTSRRTSRVTSVDDSKQGVVGDVDKDESTPTSKLDSRKASRLQSADDSTKPSDVEPASGSEVGSRKTSRQPSTDDSTAPTIENGEKSAPTSRVTSRRPSRLQSTEIPEQPSAEGATDESAPGSKLTSGRTSRVTSIDDSKEAIVEDAKDKSKASSMLTSRKPSRLQSTDDSTQHPDVETAPGSKVGSKRTSRQPSTDDSIAPTGEDKSTPTSRVTSRRPSRLQSTEIPEQPSAEDASDKSASESKLTSRKTSRVTSIDDCKKAVVEDTDESAPTSKSTSAKPSRLQSVKSTDESKKPTDDEAVPGSKVASRRTSRVPLADDENADKSTPTSRLNSRRPSRLQSTEIPEQPALEDTTNESTSVSKLSSRRTSRITSVDDSKIATQKDKENDESTPTSKLVSRLHSVDDSNKPLEDETISGSKLSSKKTSRLQSTEDSRKVVDESDKSTPSSEVASRGPSRLQSIDSPHQPATQDHKDESVSGSKLSSQRASRVTSIDDSKKTAVNDTEEAGDVPESKLTSRRTSRSQSNNETTIVAEDEIGPESKPTTRKTSRVPSVDNSGKPIDQNDDKSTPTSRSDLRKVGRLQSTDEVTNETPALKVTSQRTSRIASIDQSKQTTIDNDEGDKSVPASRKASRQASTEDSKKPSVDETGPGSKLPSKLSSRLQSIDDSGKPVDGSDKNTPSSQKASRGPSRLQSVDTPEKLSSAPESKLTSRRTSTAASTDDYKEATHEGADDKHSAPTSNVSSRRGSRLLSSKDSKKPSADESGPESKIASSRTSRLQSADESERPTNQDNDKSIPTSRILSRTASGLQPTDVLETSLKEVSNESTPGLELTSRKTSRVASIDDSKKTIVRDVDESESALTSNLASKGASRLQSIDDSTKPLDVDTAPGSKIGSRKTSRQPSTDDSKAITGENGEKSAPTSRVTSRRPSRLQSTEIPEQPSAEDATDESTPGSKLTSRRTSTVTSIDDSKKAVVEDAKDESKPSSALTSRKPSRLQSTDDSTQHPDVETAPGSKVGSRRTSRQPSINDSGAPAGEDADKSTPTSRVTSRRPSRLQSTEIPEQPSAEDATDESTPGSKLTSRRTSTVKSIDDSKKAVVEDAEDESKPSSTLTSKKPSRLQSTDDSTQLPDVEKAPGSKVGSKRTSRQPSTDDSKAPTGENEDKSTPTSRVTSRRPSRLQSTEIPEQPSVEEATDESAPGSKLAPRRTSRIASVDDSKKSLVNDKGSEDVSETNAAPRRRSRLQSTDDEGAQQSERVSRRTSRLSSTDATGKINDDEKSTPQSTSASRQGSRLQSTDTLEKSQVEEVPNKSTPGSRLTSRRTSKESGDDKDTENAIRSRRSSQLLCQQSSTDDGKKLQSGDAGYIIDGKSSNKTKAEDESEHVLSSKQAVRPADADDVKYNRPVRKDAPSNDDGIDSLTQTIPESNEIEKSTRTGGDAEYVRKIRKRTSVNEDEDDVLTHKASAPKGSTKSTDEPEAEYTKQTKRPTPSGEDADDSLTTTKYEVQSKPASRLGSKPSSRLSSIDESKKVDDDDEETSRRKRTVRKNESDTTVRRRSSEDSTKKELDRVDSVEGTRSGRSSRLNSLKGKSIKESAELEEENKKLKDFKRKDSEEEYDRLRRRSRTENTEETKKTSRQMSKLDSVTDDVDSTKSRRRSVDDKGEFPKILSGMDKDIDTFETLTASFEVVGYGTPRPAVTWFKDGEELTNSKHFVMTEEGDKYKIEIVDLRACDGGVYKAQLTNVVGEASKEATLVVSNVENLRGPKLKEGIQGKTVTKRQTAMLEAKFIADPVPDATWTVDGKDVIADCTVDVKDIELGLKECTYRMTIPSTDLNDTGTYTVKVKNKHGSAESSDSLTIVMEPIVEVFRDLVVPPTMPCTFEATVMSTPDAEVIWYVNGKQVDSDSKYTISSEKISEYKVVHRLALQDSSLSDEGEYKIVAENSVGKTDATASLKLYTEKPSFVKQLDDRTVQDYDTLHLKVRVNGLPNPEIKWYRDGKEIESDEHIRIETNEEGQVSSTLVIEHFTKDDVAEYKCTAKNIVGEAETSGKLTLAKIEPSFGENLKRVTEVGEGEPLDIITKVIGSPVPTVQWYKDGEEIKPDDARIKTSASPNGQLRLSIDEVTPNDCGAYRAVATNELGKSIANTAVVVTQAPKKPSFIKKLEDVSVVEGESIKLEVQIDGFPQPTVKWLKDGHTLHPCPRMDFISGPNNTFGLTIDKATLQDIGTYSVIISNKCGEESNACNVKVTPANKAPNFQIQLQPVKVVEGYPAKLEVKVDGFPLPKLTWYHNGEPLKIDNDNIKTGTTPEGNQCLLIDKVAPGHAGDYEVVAKNDIGESATNACLTVSPRTNAEAEHEKPVFLKGLRDITVDESGNFSISAPFRGNPIPDVQWFKDGSLLLPNERIHFTNDGYKVGLEIQDVNMGDQGFYSCALKNPYGEDSTAGHVGVRKLYQSPVFTQRFRHQQQLPKHDVKFHCRVSGVPFPSVVWHRNGLPISNSNKYQIKRDGDVCCLTVFNVSHDDEATYSCIASNREGSATCEAQLQVVDKIDATPKQEPPQFLKKIGDCEIYAGMTAKFTACASGYPEPEYEWFCDTVRLHPCDRYEMEKEGSGLVRLKIIAANPDADLGRYRLRAFNPHGEAFCEANLIFDTGLEVKSKKPIGDLYKDYDRFRATGAPLPLPDKPIIGMMTDRNLRLSWRPSMPIGPREPVTYLVEMEEQPKGKWFTARAGIRNTRCDIHDLKPFVDYKFRVRVENNYGISDPSPFVTTQRERLNPDPPKIRTYLPPNTHFHPDTCHYFPKDFDIERPPHDNYAQAPRFLRQEYDAQYGVKGHNVNLFWFVYGYPKPKITYYFNDEPIEMGGRYDCSYTRNGQATLFINKMMDRDVGVYEAVAVNEHGTARQRVQLRIAEYPEFIKRPEECWVPLRKTCKLEARVIGVPYPEIKWYKDWQPLAPSSRIQIEKIEPDVCILRITDVIKRDEGLYSIGARNIAGSISTSVYVHIEESDHDLVVGNKRGEVLSRNKKFEDLYDLGDELGRGTQGVVYHAVERNTGRNLAAKVMQGTDETRKWMTNELDIMNHLKHPNIIRPYDSLLTKRSFTILQELASGGDLLDVLTRKPYTSEYEISRYIRQLLLALDHMHDYNIAHLGITPGDLVLSHPGSNTLKLTDFGLSRRVNNRKLEPLYYGMPEYVAPELANGEGVGLSADMWSVGVITHLLLTGVSLFRGRNDVDTLDRVKEGRFSLDTDMSADARDFIIKLLMINPNNRMDVRTALSHKWIKMGNNINHPTDARRINTENLRNYYNSYKDWYSNASCRTWFRRQPLERAYKDPTRMLYPPGYKFTPAPSPEPRTKDTSQYRSWKDRLPSREPLDLEIGHTKSESHYQYGPDTYLLQLRDVDFPVRLREYMKVAKKTTSEGFDWQAPVIRERRRFMDVMDEEIDDERKARINQYGSADIYTLRRLKQEVGSRPTAHVEAEAILGSRIDGLPPFFREKPQTLSVEMEKPAELVCYAVGSPKPIVQWFKNDLVITESQRIKIVEDNEGRSILRLNPACEYDLGIYKVVARNKFGQTVARARLIPASEPNAPEAPEIVATSDTEVLLKWKQPRDDGNSSVLCYGLQYQQSDVGKWKVIADNIDHEAWLVHDLEPNTEYQFRLLAMNKIGWSVPGFPTLTVRTKMLGAEKINVPHVLRNMQTICERGKEIIGEEPRSRPNYSLEYQCLQWTEQPLTDKYRFISEIARGRFSITVKAVDTMSGNQVIAKLMETNSKTEPIINREFDILRMMRHERIAGLIEAFKLEHSSVAIFIMEKLQGADVLTYLTSKHIYTEQMVATIITQVLDGLQYLHWKGYCHLNIQPDNVVMASVRSLQVKLVDFSCAQHVHKLGTVVQNLGHIEFTAPEVLCDEPAYSYSDIWSVGVLTYILLSGVSPYRGHSELETRQNITFVRYRFEYLYKDLSQEATRFIMLLFKRTPTKRPSAEECHEHRWLLPTEYMIKKREKNSFDTAKLKVFSDDYHSKRNAEATNSREILTVVGGRVERSNSIVEELDIMNTSVH